MSWRPVPSSAKYHSDEACIDHGVQQQHPIIGPVHSALLGLWTHHGACNVQRLILGIVEAGTFPGMWLHITKFHSSEETGPALAMVATSTALWQVIGAPIAAGLMMMDGVRGLRG